MNTVFGIDINDLFRNEHEALKFAFNFQSQQYPLSPMSKLGSLEALGQGKGLVSTDGAAQAGMIRKKLDRLGEAHKHCLVARFSPKYDVCPCCQGDRALPEWRESIVYLREWSAFQVSGISFGHVREAIIMNFFDKRVSVIDAADRVHMNQRTARRHTKNIQDKLKVLELEALGAIRAALEFSTG
ncbi:DNA-binding protein [Herbaspirillum rubrisubalbicans]|uniref:DNA-binding protein n=1 Tax=Herbaspirillum rubrisubalbicans TaxID=80842 RepID=UPI0015C543AE|nr:DNA-binding protein [Herbaspirillum rubrisubalbicans]